MCFFLQALHKFIKSYKGLFGDRDDEEGSDEGSSGEAVDAFVRRYGWIYSAREIATFEGISLDQCWELPIVQAFNDMAYLKEKARHDKELIEKERANINLNG